MSTPTHSTQTPQQPGSASKKAAGHVTTPSHLGLASPAPRSVPSPAATRKDQAGKTPINHPTASSTGSKTLGSTPMVPNLSNTGMTVSSSPGAHNASFGTPGALAGLGVDLGSSTPGQLSNLLAGGAAMMPTMSDLGLSSRSGKKNEDEERRERMRKVLKNIGRRKGRPNQDAFVRMGRRVGLDVDADGDTAEERAKTFGDRDLAIAGSIVLVEVSLKQHVPQKVEVLLSDEQMDMQEFAEPAGKVLMRDLGLTEGILLHSNLDKFARNLNRLARLDILSKNGKVSCFRAIFGVCKNLKKLYELEKEAVKVQLGESVANPHAAAEDEVLRKRSGRPIFHANERIGLALEYWTPAKSPNKQDDSAMDVDGEVTDSVKSNQPDIYRLRIDAESAPAPMHAAIRVSDAWLPETFEIPTPESGEPLPWQDPPPTYMTETTSNGQDGVMAVDGTQRVPDIRFVAKLDPPVVLPWNIVNLLSEVGIEIPPMGQITDYYESLLGMPTHTLANRQEPIEVEQTVLALRDGQEVEVTHRYVLDISKPEHGYKLEKMYFSHPRQLVGLLPVLRQWAQVAALVQGAFGNLTQKTQAQAPAPLANGNHTNGHTNGDSMDIDSTPGCESLLVSIGLSALPNPSLSITYPDSSGQDLKSTIFQILPNASLAVTSSDGAGEGGDEEKGRKMAKALEVCGDLGVWVEWMRSK